MSLYGQEHPLSTFSSALTTPVGSRSSSPIDPSLFDLEENQLYSTSVIGRKLDALSLGKGRSRSSSPIRCISLLATRNAMQRQPMSPPPHLKYTASKKINRRSSHDQAHIIRRTAGEAAYHLASWHLSREGRKGDTRESEHCIAPTTQSPANFSVSQGTSRERIRPCTSLKISVPEDFPPEPGTTFHQGDMGNSRASELRTLSSQVPRGRNSERVRCSMECSEVIRDQLFLGGIKVAMDPDIIKSKGITHVINCAGPAYPNFYDSRFPPNAPGDPRLTYLRLDLYDAVQEEITWFIYQAFDFIIDALKTKEARILIHCVRGISRSCSLAIAWLMFSHGMGYSKALRQVQAARDVVQPNVNFLLRLEAWSRRRNSSRCGSEPSLPSIASVPGPVSDATMEISLISEEGVTSPLMSPLMGGSVDAEFSYIMQKELINSPLEPIPYIFSSSSSPSRFMDRMIYRVAYHNVSPEVCGDLLFKLCLDESQTHHGLHSVNVEVLDDRTCLVFVDADRTTYLWIGSSATEDMIKLAKQGALWLHKYEGCALLQESLISTQGNENPELIVFLHSLQPHDKRLKISSEVPPGNNVIYRCLQFRDLDQPTFSEASSSLSLSSLLESLEETESIPCTEQ
eukprot:300852_1